MDNLMLIIICSCSILLLLLILFILYKFVLFDSNLPCIKRKMPFEDDVKMVTFSDIKSKKNQNLDNNTIFIRMNSNQSKKCLTLSKTKVSSVIPFKKRQYLLRMISILLIVILAFI